MMKTLKPTRLAKGDVIGIISPASPIADTSKIQEGVRYLESLGYRTLVGRHAEAKKGYLAGTDKQRLADIHAMFRNRHVKAIFCVRGGYGSPRLLPSLDYALVRANPRILVGFSDVTAIHLALWHRCRLVTFSGPMVGVDMLGKMDPFTEENFWRVLSLPMRDLRISLDGETTTVLHRGRGEGRILGGNLSLVAGLIGTPYIPEFRDSILFLEDVGEEPYRIDRMFTQLRNSGVLGSAKCLLAGQFTDCVAKQSIPGSQTIEEVLSEIAGHLKVPFLANLPFGHQPAKLTIPIGVRARVNTRTFSIDLLESPVT